VQYRKENFGLRDVFNKEPDGGKNESEVTVVRKMIGE